MSICCHYRLNCTKLRHLAASLVSAVLKPEDRAALASLMTHSENMQQQSYNDLLATAKKVRISIILVKILSGKELTEADLSAAEYGRQREAILLKIRKYKNIYVQIMNCVVSKRTKLEYFHYICI